MTAFEVVPATPLTFWSLICRTVFIIKGRPLFFFGLATIAVLPGNLLEWWGYEAASRIIPSFFSTALFGIFAYVVFKEVRENEFVSLSQALSHALRWPLLGVVIMWAIFWILSIIWEAWIYCLGNDSGLIIAGFAPMVLYFGLFSIVLATIPACIIENLGFLESLQRSVELTSGYRMRIFFLMVGTCCLFVLSAFLLFLGLSTVLFDGIFLPSIPDNQPPSHALLANYLMYTIFCILLEVFSITMYSVMYCDLRHIEDGLSA